MLATKLLLIGLTEVRREGIHIVKNTVKNDGMSIDFAGTHRKQKPRNPYQDSGFQLFLDYVLVEAAGVEPASENIPHRHLHTYPEF